PADREAEPRSRYRGVARGLEAGEPDEEVSLLGGGDALAVVLDAEDHEAAVHARGQPDPRPAELERVGGEVDEDLLDPGRVAHDQGRHRRADLGAQRGAPPP